MLAIITYGFVILITSVAFSSIDFDKESSHIVFSIISWGLIFNGFILSFVYNYQKRHLHSHKINKYINFLPALDTTESLLFSNIYLGWIFLTIAIISGFAFLDDMFAQHLVHKTFFAIISWILLLVISSLRIFKCLRDNKATLTIQISFILLLIGYFGSKAVLYLILS